MDEIELESDYTENGELDDVLDHSYFNEETTETSGNGEYFFKRFDSDELLREL